MAYIEKRGKDKYRIIVTRNDPYTGEKKRFRMTFNGTKHQAEREAIQFEASLDNDHTAFADRNMTFFQFAQMFIDEYGRPELSPKTVKEYIGHLNNRLVPYFGRYKLKEITPIICLRYFNNMENFKNLRTSGYISGTSQKRIHELLTAMFNRALKWQLINTNPMIAIDAPKKDTKPAKFYDADQVGNLLYELQLLPDELYKYRAIINLAVFTGMRRGEIMGLEWHDIDFIEKTITVQRESVYVGSAGGGIIAKTPKTEHSIRTFTIGDNLLAILKKYKAIQNIERLEWGPEWIASDRLFTQENGAPMHPDTISNWFPRWLESVGLPRITLHQLRHTCATLLLNDEYASHNLKVIAERLGWSDPSMLLKVYGHALKRSDQKAAERLDEIIQLKSVVK